MEQDTIENVSQPNFFLNFLRIFFFFFLNHSMPKMFSPSTIFKKKDFAHEKNSLKSYQIQPKSQFLFHKNLPLRDFSIMTLIQSHYTEVAYGNVSSRTVHTELIGNIQPIFIQFFFKVIKKLLSDPTMFQKKNIPYSHEQKHVSVSDTCY